MCEQEACWGLYKGPGSTDQSCQSRLAPGESRLAAGTSTRAVSILRQACCFYFPGWRERPKRSCFDTS